MEGKSFGPEDLKNYRDEIKDENRVVEESNDFLLNMLSDVVSDIKAVLEESNNPKYITEDLLTRLGEAKERKSRIEELLEKAGAISGKAKEQIEVINEVIKELESKLN